MQSDPTNTPEPKPETAPTGAERAAEQPYADPQARIAELEAENQDLRDRWMRAEAENQNIRARAKREVEETRQYAVQKFAADVVEAAENLRRGLASLPAAEPDEPAIVGRLREGLEGIERSFLGILERNGIRREDPTGALFDPNLHQAMGEQVTEEHPPGTVVQAWTSGWTLNGRLLKPAMVVVAKAPPAELPQPANESRPGAGTPPRQPAAGFTA
jgi:molecular chaperone GrpE